MWSRLGEENLFITRRIFTWKREGGSVNGRGIGLPTKKQSRGKNSILSGGPPVPLLFVCRMGESGRREGPSLLTRLVFLLTGSFSGKVLGERRGRCSRTFFGGGKESHE